MNMYASEALKACHGEQPRSYELTQNIASMLEQFGAKLEDTKIPTLLNETLSLAGETGAKIAMLHAETLVQAKMKGYMANVAMLEEAQKERVASLLGGIATNDHAPVSMAA